MRAVLPLLCAVVVLALPCSASSASPRVPVHRIALPAATRVPFAQMAAVQGQPRSPEHPFGTVLVAELERGAAAPTITEWELATGRLVRRVALPWPRSFTVFHIVRAGDRVHLVGGEPRGGALEYVALDAGLQVKSRERLGRGFAQIATDGGLVAILWSGVREGGGPRRGWHLMTRRSDGALVATALVFDVQDSDLQYASTVAVAGGKVFVIAPPTEPLAALVRYSADLEVEQQVRPSTSRSNPAVYAVGARILVHDGCTLLWQDPVTMALLDTHPVPYRPERYPWCPDFALAADASGWTVTSRGDVLDASLDVAARLDDVVGRAVTTPLWLSGAPALLEIESAERAAIVWTDGSVP